MARPSRVTPRPSTTRTGSRPATGGFKPTVKTPKTVNRPATAAMNAQGMRSMTGMNKIVEKRRPSVPKKTTSQTTFKKKGGGFAR